MTMNTPNGPMKATLTLKSDGVALTGSIAGGLGSVDLEDGKIDGDNLSWRLTVPQMNNMIVNCTATIDGDELTGEAEMGSFGKATLEATRA